MIGGIVRRGAERCGHVWLTCAGWNSGVLVFRIRCCHEQDRRRRYGCCAQSLAVEQAYIGREIRVRTLEAQGFTRVTGGYAFRVPSAWMFWPR